MRRLFRSIIGGARKALALSAARTGCLHHLVYCAVTIGRKKALAELYRKLVDGVALAIEIEILPYHRFLEDCSVRVMFHSFFFLKSYY